MSTEKGLILGWVPVTNSFRAEMTTTIRDQFGLNLQARDLLGLSDNQESARIFQRLLITTNAGLMQNPQYPRISLGEETPILESGVQPKSAIFPILVDSLAIRDFSHLRRGVLFFKHPEASIMQYAFARDMLCQTVSSIRDPQVCEAIPSFLDQNGWVKPRITLELQEEKIPFLFREFLETLDFKDI